MVRNFHTLVLSKTPPENTNVIWIYPFDDKHYDVRIYTIVLLDEFTCIKKWTSIGITDLNKTDLSTQPWYIGKVKEVPYFNLNVVNTEVLDIAIIEEQYSEDLPILSYRILDNFIGLLNKKLVYFDTTNIDPEEDYKYLAIVIPEDYIINSLYKENYYEDSKSYQKDVLIEGDYRIEESLELDGSYYKLLLLSFDNETTPYQITTTVIKNSSDPDFIVSELGDNDNKVISLKSLTLIINDLYENINNIPNDNNIVHELGDSGTAIISQKAITQIFQDLSSSIELSIDNILPDYSIDNTELVLKVNNEGNLVWSDSNSVDLLGTTGESTTQGMTQKAITDSLVNLSESLVNNIDTKLNNYSKKTSVTYLPSLEDNQYIDIIPDERIVIEDPITTDVTFTTNTAVEGKVNIYEVMFQLGDTVPQLTFPRIVWIKLPIFNSNKRYLISLEQIASGKTPSYRYLLGMYVEYNNN